MRVEIKLCFKGNVKLLSCCCSKKKRKKKRGNVKLTFNQVLSIYLNAMAVL